MVNPPGIDQQITFVYCADLAATDVFYRGVLRLPLVLDQGACRIYRAGRDAFLGFCRGTENLSAIHASGVILTLVVDERESVDAWYQYLVESGYGTVVEKKPAFNSKFAIYHLFLRDPDGNLVEIQTFLDPAWPRRADN